MSPNAILHYNRFIDIYQEIKIKEKNEKDKIKKSLYSDERREIEEVFEKIFHKPIDKSSKL